MKLKSYFLKSLILASVAGMLTTPIDSTFAEERISSQTLPQNWTLWSDSRNTSKPVMSIVDDQLIVNSDAPSRGAVYLPTQLEAGGRYRLNFAQELSDQSSTITYLRVQHYSENRKQISLERIASGDSFLVPEGAVETRLELFFENFSGQLQFSNISLDKIEIIPDPIKLTIQADTYTPRDDVKTIVSGNSVYLENGLLLIREPGSSVVELHDGQILHIEVTEPTDPEPVVKKDLTANLSFAETPEMVSRVDRDARQALTKLNAISTTLTPDQVQTTFSDINLVAKAVTYPGSTYYQSQETIQFLKDKIAFLVNHFYNLSTTPKGNWYTWELGIARVFTKALTYLEPHYSQEELQTYKAILDRFTPQDNTLGVTHTNTFEARGSNLAELSQIQILKANLVGDQSRVSTLTQNLADNLFGYQTSGDGFYSDGSFLSHNSAQIGAYGLNILPPVSEIASLLPDTFYETFVARLKSHYLPYLTHSTLDPTVAGRSISRKNDAERSRIAFIRNLMRISIYAPEPQQSELLAIIKKLMETTPISPISDNERDAIARLSEITPYTQAPSTLYHEVAGRIIHTRPHYALTIALPKGNLYDNTNGENRQGYYTLDGSIYIFDFAKKYDGDFWEKIDYQKIPGTTEIPGVIYPGNTPTRSLVKPVVEPNTYEVSFSTRNGELTYERTYTLEDDKLTVHTKDISNPTAITTIENYQILNSETKFFINGQQVHFTGSRELLVETIRIENPNGFIYTYRFDNPENLTVTFTENGFFKVIKTHQDSPELKYHIEFQNNQVLPHTGSNRLVYLLLFTLPLSIALRRLFS